MPGHASARAILAAEYSGQAGPVVVTLLPSPKHRATCQGPLRAGQRWTASVRVHPVRAARDSLGRCRPRLPICRGIGRRRVRPRQQTARVRTLVRCSENALMAGRAGFAEDPLVVYACAYGHACRNRGRSCFALARREAGVDAVSGFSAPGGGCEVTRAPGVLGRRNGALDRGG